MRSNRIGLCCLAWFIAAGGTFFFLNSPHAGDLILLAFVLPVLAMTIALRVIFKKPRPGIGIVIAAAPVVVICAAEMLWMLWMIFMDPASYR